MHIVLKKLSELLQKKLLKKKMPNKIQPMLATLTHTYFSDPEWIFERKFDGERCIVFKKGDTVSLRTRNNIYLNDTYPEIVEAVKKLAVEEIIIDGEIVAFDGRITNFSLLQGRMGLLSADKSSKKIKIYLYVFDILYIDGYSVVRIPLITRKKILKQICALRSPLRYVTHRLKYGKQYRAYACAHGWEGVIAKRKDSVYESKRSKNWLKFKCGQDQEFVIGGYTKPHGSRTGFGALLLGYYKQGRLHYAGKVGTGFSEELLKSLYKKLHAITNDRNPFAHVIKETNVFFVTPTLVAQIGFTEWTVDGKLRHPRFLGLRDDKKARDVIRES